MRAVEPLLEVQDVSAGYGRARVLFGVGLAVPRGSAVAVVGPNGAGKTTLARVCCGLLGPSAGHVVYQGADIAGAPPYRLARRGLVHVPEGQAVFATLTVEENLALRLRQALGRSGAKAALAAVYDRFPRLGRRRDQKAGSLSGGEQRVLALAPVLVRPPGLVVLDELTLGLDPNMVEEVQGLLRSVAGSGSAMLVLEQRLGRALAVADRVVFLTRGRVEADVAASRLAGEAASRLAGEARPRAAAGEGKERRGVEGRSGAQDGLSSGRRPGRPSRRRSSG